MNKTKTKKQEKRSGAHAFIGYDESKGGEVIKWLVVILQKVSMLEGPDYGENVPADLVKACSIWLPP